MITLALVLAQAPVQPPLPPFTRESCTFGVVVSAAGDQNADGTPDLLVGEEKAASLDCWILSGKDGSTLKALHIERMEGGNSHVEFGPDVDGDGARDLLVCLRRWSTKDKDAGALMVVSAKSGRIVWRISTRTSGGSTGDSARFVRDVDGDGVEDIALLVPRPLEKQATLRLISGKSGETIRELAFENPGGREVGGLLELSDLDGDGKREFAVMLAGSQSARAAIRAVSLSKKSTLWTSPSRIEGGSAYGALARLDDLDGDGVQDLIAGYLDSVDVVSGKTGVAFFHIDPPDRTDSQLGFGSAVASLGDANGDGLCDLVLSEPEAGFVGNVRAYSGKDASPLWVMSPAMEKDVYHFGYQLAAVGDVDGDGVTELAVGSWEGAAAKPGYACLLSGKTGVILFEYRRGAEGVVARNTYAARATIR